MDVLIVDDSMTIRRVIENLLNGVGILNVDHADCGVSALKMITGKKYDLIILDVYMPDMLGTDVLNIIRQENKDVHIIMCSKETEKKWIIECLKQGITDYISKPFNKDIFITKILKLVDAAKSDIEIW